LHPGGNCYRKSWRGDCSESKRYKSGSNITIQSSGHHATISFKNVSKYEISENREELFERFKRGDSSRHTEGSGLGLAIAKSIVDLHEGNLNIEVDGDLFKVTITLKVQE